MSLRPVGSLWNSLELKKAPLKCLILFWCQLHRRFARRSCSSGLACWLASLVLIGEPHRVRAAGKCGFPVRYSVGDPSCAFSQSVRVRKVSELRALLAVAPRGDCGPVYQGFPSLTEVQVFCAAAGIDTPPVFQCSIHK